MTVRQLIHELLELPMDDEVLVGWEQNDTQILAKCTGVEVNEDLTVTIQSGDRVRRKLIAIHGGGDWADASAEYLMLPEGMDANQEHWKYKQAMQGKVGGEYKSFCDWLKERGAREPTNDELEIIDDTPW